MQAYKNTVVESGETPQSLPSLTSFTDEQLFFIAFGQVMNQCTHNNELAPGRYMEN